MKFHIEKFSIALLTAWGVAQAADLDQGRTRSLACQACHGSAGISVSADIPNLAGQKPGYLAAQLQAFREGGRKQELMNAIASQLNDADIANLSAFWSSLPAGGADTPDLAAAIRRSHMTFPASFPADFVRYSEDTDPADKSFKRSFVNRAALAAARANKPLPPGSAIVVENFAAGGTSPVSYAAMESRAGWGDDIPEILRNGDWNYGLFSAEKKLSAGFNYARCLACHIPAAKTSYVFGLEAIAKTK